MPNDYSLPTGTDKAKVAIKTKIPNAFEALRSLFLSDDEPSSPIAAMLWGKPTDRVIYQRNAANNAWAVFGPLYGNLGRQQASLVMPAMAGATHRLFAAPAPLKVVRVGILSGTTTSGSSAGVTDWTFLLRNVTQGLDLMAAALSTGAGVRAGSQKPR